MTSAIQDSRYSWFRLAVSLALSTIGGIGLWAGIVVLPFIQVEFGVDRSGASFPYTMTMIGFALGGVLMGRVRNSSFFRHRPALPQIFGRMWQPWLVSLASSAVPQPLAPSLPMSRSGSRSAAALRSRSSPAVITSRARSGRQF